MDKKKDNHDQDNRNSNNDNNGKYKNIVNWRSHGYYGEVQFITAMNNYKCKMDTLLKDFKFKQFHNAYCDQTTFRLEILMAGDVDDRWDEKLEQDSIKIENLNLF